MRYMTLVFSFLLVFAAQGMAEAANPCNPCAMNPCGMKANPCAMKHKPCNPCSMKKTANPCALNPCSAATNTPIRPHAFNSFQGAVALGKKMWNDDEGMGTAGVACLSCHADFDLLNFEKRQNFPHYVTMVGDVVTLDQMINYCLLNPMKGKQLEKKFERIDRDGCILPCIPYAIFGKTS